MLFMSNKCHCTLLHNLVHWQRLKLSFSNNMFNLGKSSGKSSIVFLDSGTLFDVPNMGVLSGLGEYTDFRQTKSEEVLERVKDAEIVITSKVKIDRDIIYNCKKLKLICVAATGVNNIDVEVAKEQNIQIRNVPNYSTNSVAQVAWGMILHLNNHVLAYDKYVKSGEYIKSEFFTNVINPFNDLNGKTLGIIGLSTIGKQVAQIGQAFGMKIVYTSISGKSRDYRYSHLDLDALLKRSDVVSIHTPLTSQTKRLIDYEHIKRMKPTAILINTSRGEILREKDLIEALNENIIAGAGLDVFENEPIIPESPLFKLREMGKIVTAPHIGWASTESRMRLVETIKQNIEEYLKHK